MCDNFKEEVKEDSEAKSNELAGAISELQLLSEAADKYRDLTTAKKQMEEEHGEILESKNKIIQSLKTKLENVNDVMKYVSNQNDQYISKLAPSALAASKMLTSGVTFTQVFCQFVHISNELAEVKYENIELTNNIVRILSELDQNVPCFRRIALERDQTNELNTAMSAQIESLVAECNNLRDECSEANKIVNHYSRENARIKSEQADLGRQICFLLKEVEQSRGGELQENNSKLLQLVRELTSKQEEAERNSEDGNALHASTESLNKWDSFSNKAVSPDSPVKPVELEKLQTELTQKEKQLEELKEEYKTYKENTMGDQRVLFEEIDKVCNENGKLKEKCKKLSTTIAHWEMVIKQQREESLKAQTKCEVALDNSRQECKLLKDSENRLKLKRDFLNQEHQSQSFRINNLEMQLSEVQQSESQLKEKCGEFEAELSLQSNGQYSKEAELKRQLSETKSRLDNALKELEEKSTQSITARDELTTLAITAQSPDEKFAVRMIVLHSSDIKKFSELKEKYSKLSSHFEELLSTKDQAIENLENNKKASEERQKILESEKEIIQSRLTDLMSQNSALHDHVEALSAYLSISCILKQSDSFNDSSTDVNRSLNDDEFKSSEHLEIARWRNRCKELVERTNKTSPEDWKRLQNERETLVKLLSVEQETLKKLKEDITSIRLQKTQIEEQLANSRKQNLALNDDNKKLTEEMSVVKQDVAKITQELKDMQIALTDMTEQKSKLTDLLASKENELSETRNLVTQGKHEFCQYTDQLQNKFSDSRKKMEKYVQNGNVRTSQYEGRLARLEKERKYAIVEHTKEVESLQQKITLLQRQLASQPGTKPPATEKTTNIKPMAGIAQPTTSRSRAGESSLPLASVRPTAVVPPSSPATASATPVTPTNTHTTEYMPASSSRPLQTVPADGATASSISQDGSTPQQVVALVMPRVEGATASAASTEATSGQQAPSSSAGPGSGTPAATALHVKRPRPPVTGMQTQSTPKRSRLCFERSVEVEYQVPTSSRCDQEDDGVIVVDLEDEDNRCSGTGAYQAEEAEGNEEGSEQEDEVEGEGEEIEGEESDGNDDEAVEDDEADAEMGSGGDLGNGCGNMDVGETGEVVEGGDSSMAECRQPQKRPTALHVKRPRPPVPGMQTQSTPERSRLCFERSVEVEYQVPTSSRCDQEDDGVIVVDLEDEDNRCSGTGAYQAEEAEGNEEGSEQEDEVEGEGEEIEGEESDGNDDEAVEDDEADIKCVTK